jgi:hypothetical protein
MKDLLDLMVNTYIGQIKRIKNIKNIFKIKILLELLME